METDRKPRLWTKAEIDKLKRLYPMSHNKDLARILNHTILSVLGKAKKLGIKKDWAGGYRVPPPPQTENVWSKEEIKTLRKMYLNSTVSEIAAKLKRSKQAVQSKTKKLGLFHEFKKQGLFRKTKNGAHRWTEGEINILKELYPQKRKNYIAEKLGRSPKAVEVMAIRLKLTAAPRESSWTVENDEFVKNHIAEWPIEEIAKKLNRTPNAVQRRAWDKHFSRNCPNQHHTQDKSWTTQEIAQLKHWHKKLSKRKIAEKLGRSTRSVKAKAEHLGLKKRQVWTPKNIAILKKYFPFETNSAVAKRIGTYPLSVSLKANELGLKKSVYIEHKYEIF